MAAARHFATAVGQLIGSSVEAGATAASAVVSNVSHAVTVRKSIESADLPKHGLSEKLRRDPFRLNFRKRVLEDPQRALETLQPYANLDLHVVCGKDLLPADYGVVFNATSDPFVEVWLNDVKQEPTSCWRLWSLNPRWDFNLSLPIYSPESIVHVRVMDRDSVTKSDLMGFVEFCVADLVHDEELAGWFELRLPKRLLGTADRRVYKHMRRRDDDPIHWLNDASEGDNGEARMPSSQLASTEHADACSKAQNDPHVASADELARKPGPKVNTGFRSLASCVALGCHKARTRDDLPPTSRRPNTNGGVAEIDQQGLGSKGDCVDGRLVDLRAVESKPSGVSARQRGFNAGEIYIRMALRADSFTADEDEMYAFCFPKPQYVRFGKEGDIEHTIDFAEVYEDICELELMLVSLILRRVLCVVEYLLTWKCVPLTLCLLIWWCVFCWRPLSLSWTLPLWPALLFYLLRQDEWRMEMVAFEGTAPLNDEGFAVIASLRNSHKMCVWLGRLIRSLDGNVDASSAEAQRALAESIFRDGRPLISFSELHDEIHNMPWIKWSNNNCAAVCPRNHRLKYLGFSSPAVIQEDRLPNRPGEPKVPWRCDHPKGCYHHTNRMNCHRVGRYHCSTCDYDLCEHCVSRSVKAPVLMQLPQDLMPGALVSLFRVVEFPAHDGRILLSEFLRQANVYFMHGVVGNAKAQSLYNIFASISLALAIWQYLLQRFVLVDEMSSIALRGSCIIGGGALLTSRLPCMLRERRKLMAIAKQKKYKHRRHTGGCAEHWAFLRLQELGEVIGRHVDQSHGPPKSGGVLQSVSKFVSAHSMHRSREENHEVEEKPARLQLSGSWHLTTVDGEWNEFLEDMGYKVAKRLMLKGMGYGVGRVKEDIRQDDDKIRIHTVSPMTHTVTEFVVNGTKQQATDAEGKPIIVSPCWRDGKLVTECWTVSPRDHLVTICRSLETDNRMHVRMVSAKGRRVDRFFQRV